MDEIEKKVDDWWTKVGRSDFIARVKHYLSDTKVVHLVKIKHKEELKQRLPHDVWTFIASEF